MTIALGFLYALGMLIALVNGETDGALWGLWFPGAITAILSVILIVGRSQAKGVLRPA